MQPTTAYVGATWAVFGLGVIAYLVGLYNATLPLNEKGYYFTVLLLGLYAAISLQKTIRDEAENIPTSALYRSISWAALVIALILLAVGLFNATLTLSEKGFYAIAFAMSLFAVITIQKNVRDIKAYQQQSTESTTSEPTSISDFFDKNDV